jgi:hypothetical protein
MPHTWVLRAGCSPATTSPPSSSAFPDCPFQSRPPRAPLRCSSAPILRPLSSTSEDRAVLRRACGPPWRAAGGRGERGFCSSYTRATAGMAVGAEVAKAQPALVITARMGTKMHRGGDVTWALDQVALEAVREDDSRRVHTRRNGALRQALKRFGFARAFAFGSGEQRFV